jgi:plasmid maintenance system killer protein
MRAAHRIDDLYPIKSLQYEKNVEKLNYRESVKIDEQHRILFESTAENTFIIKEVLRNETSKHYGN